MYMRSDITLYSIKLCIWK